MQHTQAQINDSRFEHSQQYAIDVRDSLVSLVNNQLRGIDNNSGIRLRGQTVARIEDNLIGNSQGSAVDASEVSGAILVNSRIGNTPEYAISLRNAAPLPGPLTLSGNTLGKAGKAVVRVEGLQQVVLDATQRPDRVVRVNQVAQTVAPSALRCVQSASR
ncbi:right-handed parallel beta-helix repeat-containing protein [Pseudomonas sp. BBP2017]|uniref:right-handed parallel beta-helix repeat-containing protein n=1 Tax=Pseudomonas sp. BBP2017 TaxID=2109731 RepID=UPI002115492A|nr:right-handed parallel beta-helix repeat-containing protein [Pseudomonas sp. BBP2017]